MTITSALAQQNNHYKATKTVIYKYMSYRCINYTKFTPCHRSILKLLLLYSCKYKEYITSYITMYPANSCLR